MEMTDLNATARELEKRIATAGTAGRLALQPELHRLIHRLKAEGQPVPRRLRQLDEKLSDELVEAMFDNMPV